MEWSERFPLILAIVRKDLYAARWWMAAGIVPAIVGLIMTTPLALSMASVSYYYPYQFIWYDASLRSYYGLAALLTSVALGLAFSRTYTGEIHQGTIRSVVLYPVSVEDIVLAKLGSAFTIAFIVSFPIFLGFTVPFFAEGLFPVGDFLLIYFVSLLMGLVAMLTGVGLSLLVTHYAKRVLIGPSTLGSLFLLLAVLLTEEVMTSIGDYLLVLTHAPNSAPTQAELQAVLSFAQAVSVLSPQHMGARILGDVFGIANLWPDIHVVVPVFIVVAVAAHVLSKRLYPDLFVS